MTKYKAIRTQVDGIMFDSKKESERYKYLKQRLDDGIIQDLKLQPKFDCYFLSVQIN